MPRIGSITVSVFRDESAETSKLLIAKTNARLEFPELPLNKTAQRDGVEYRYCDLNTVKRVIYPVLARHGLDVLHQYTTHDQTEYLVTSLRHTSGQYIASISAVPYYPDAQEHKMRKSMLCKTHVEGLLGISTEDDTDGAGSNGEVSDTSPEQQARIAAAIAKMKAAKSRDAAAKLLAHAEGLVNSGELPESAVRTLVEEFNSRFPETDGGEDD